MASMKLDNLRSKRPELSLLDADDPGGLERYLQRLGVIGMDVSVESVEKAGEGNMNCTLRVRAGELSLIVKQSRPWVERYPEIEAPWDRVLSEARWYLLASPHEAVSRRMPRQLELDPKNRVLVLEDLGRSSDFTGVYAGQQLDLEELRTLVDWLSDLHAIDFQAKSRASLANLPMRKLNHEHIFRFPLETGNDLDLDAITPGLRAEADHLGQSTEYVNRVAALGESYLEPGAALLHGDFFPGSWLRTARGPAVIDPEFGFFGPAEFDVGVLLAHLYLAAQGEPAHEVAVSCYRASAGFDWSVALAFCGVEIMRRLIGVAQLPLSQGIEEKRRLLELSHDLVAASDPLDTEGLMARRALRVLMGEGSAESRSA